MEEPFRREEVFCQDGNTTLLVPIQTAQGVAYVNKPLYLPVSVLLRRVDFIESFDVAPNAGWSGSYYKLLNAAQRPRLVAGTDSTCRSALDQPRTYVLLEEPTDPLTYDGWIDGIAVGRTSIADDEHYFIDLKLGPDGEYRVGDQIDIVGSSIRVQAELLSDLPTPNEYIEIVVNGEVVDCTQAGVLTFDKSISFSESSWIAARQGPTMWSHTAATYVIVDNKPIAVCRDAEYWLLYLDVLRARLDDLACVPDVGLGCQMLRTECCTTIDKLVADAEAAQDVFLAIRDYAHQDVLPGVDRVGYSTYACWGPVAIGIDAYSTVQRQLFCFNAPPNTTGELRVSKSLLQTPLVDPNTGVTLFLGPTLEPVVPVSSNDAGFVRTTVSVPPSAYGKRLYYQYVWDGNCGGLTGGSASDVLSVPWFKPL